MNSTVPSSRSDRSRRRAWWLAAVLAAVACGALLPGCGSDPPLSPPNANLDQLESWRWFPLREGDRWVYESQLGSQLVYVTEDVIAGDATRRAALSLARPSVTWEYARWTGGNLQRSLEDDFSESTLELTPPIEPGRSWRKVDLSSETTTFYSDASIIDTAAAVTTPAGSWSTLAVRTITVSEYPNVPRSVDTSYTYYARDIGIVKWIDGATVVELQSFEPGAGE